MTERPSAERITACMVCRNEADRIGPALESVQWCDEIVVMDLESSDASAALATEAGARVISHAPVPVVEAVRNDLAAATHSDWILVLDPDERVSPGLARELDALRGREDIDAVVVPRMNVDLGFAPTNALHRYEQQLRLYRRSRVEWPLFPNALPQVPEARIHRIAARDDLVLVHDRSRTIPEVLDRVLRYAPAQAQAMVDAGEVFTASRMLTTLSAKARREFVRGEPWRDGVPGVVRAGIIVTFHFYVWAAFWQLSGRGRTAEDDRLLQRVGSFVSVGSRLARAVHRLGGRLPKRR
jgi:glycosyltransferase involved in cell wall biosynthesis